MLVTDVGDQMCWRQDLDAGDKSRNQHRELDTNITFWRTMMLMTDVSPSGSVKRWKKCY